MRVRVVYTTCNKTGVPVAVFNFEILPADGQGSSAVAHLPQG